MIIYNKFESLLKEKGIGKTELQKRLEISPSTMANFGKNKYVSLAVIDKICGELKCQPGDIMEWVEDADKAEIASIEQQIAELEAKKKQLQGK